MARGKYGAGTAWQRPDGLWAAQWSAGRDAYGQRIRGSVSGYPTEAAARKAMTEARGKSSSTRPRRRGETVGPFLERWLEEVVRVKRREKTYWGYRSIVELHVTPALGGVVLTSLDRGTVQRWVDGQDAAPLTVRHRLDCLRSALSQAVRWDMIARNPARDIVLPAVRKRPVRALSFDDAQRIVEATEGEWFGPLVVAALYTGLRQGELLGLRLDDVTDDAITVHNALARLPGQHGTRYVLDAPKSSSSRRTVPLVGPAPDTLRAARRRALTQPNPHRLVFPRPDGRPIDGTRLTQDFQASLARAGLPRMRWHDLRHGWVSLMLASGVPLAEISPLAGHSGIAITADTYAHLTLDSKRTAMDKMAARMAAGR